MKPIKELVVGTRNNKKLKEVKALLKDTGIKVLCLSDVKNVPLVKETGNTFKANARKKAVETSLFLKKPVLAEDSGLEVTALNNAPGVYSSRFCGKEKNDFMNNLKLLRLLGQLPLKKRQAKYQCAVVIADARRIVYCGQSSCKGFIDFEFKGNAGFGYDPLFISPMYNKTFAQLGERIKNKISHRAKAFQKLKKFLISQS
ncbi:MAG: RdgB/HAM1 family non-canonical purine NTP pyrophosphatase [Candidatus Gygaella obscura]|nr:RdgB/HAM1 family non-canonical purine NTP pyrophosphatase [Candidatus Gygaella obscura]